MQAPPGLAQPVQLQMASVRQVAPVFRLQVALLELVLPVGPQVSEQLAGSPGRAASRALEVVPASEPVPLRQVPSLLAVWPALPAGPAAARVWAQLGLPAELEVLPVWLALLPAAKQAAQERAQVLRPEEVRVVLQVLQVLPQMARAHRLPIPGPTAARPGRFRPLAAGGGAALPRSAPHPPVPELSGRARCEHPRLKGILGAGALRCHCLRPSPEPARCQSRSVFAFSSWSTPMGWSSFSTGTMYAPDGSRSTETGP